MWNDRVKCRHEAASRCMESAPTRTASKSAKTEGPRRFRPAEAGQHLVAFCFRARKKILKLESCAKVVKPTKPKEWYALTKKFLNEKGVPK